MKGRVSLICHASTCSLRCEEYFVVYVLGDSLVAGQLIVLVHSMHPWQGISIAQMHCQYYTPDSNLETYLDSACRRRACQTPCPAVAPASVRLCQTCPALMRLSRRQLTACPQSHFRFVVVPCRKVALFLQLALSWVGGLYLMWNIAYVPLCKPHTA